MKVIVKVFFALLLILPNLSFKFTNGSDIFFGDSITFGNELGSQQYSSRWSTKYCTDVSTLEANFALSGATMTPGLNPGRPVFDVNNVPLYASDNRHIFISYWVNDFMYGGTTAAFITATTNAVNGILARGWPADKIVLCFNFLPLASVSHATAMLWRSALKNVQMAKGTSFLDFYTAVENMPNNLTYSTDDIHPVAPWNAIMDSLTQTNIELPGSAPLPATLLSFSGGRRGNATTLLWTVAQEQNVQVYQVERSQNGRDWITAGTVTSLGNTSSQRSYSFTDNTSTDAKQYYQLRQIDVNGTMKLSNIVVVNGTKAATLYLSGVFPNPTSTSLNIMIDAPVKDLVTVTVEDAMGHLAKRLQTSIEPGSNTVALDVNKMASGTYFVKIIGTGYSQSLTSKFVKE